MVGLTIQEIGSHEEFQCNLRSNGEFWDLCGAVGVTDLVGEVHAHLGENMRRDLPEVYFVGFIFCKLPCKERLDLTNVFKRSCVVLATLIFNLTSLSMSVVVYQQICQ